MYEAGRSPSLTNIEPEAFADADYAMDVTTRKSTSGGIIFLNGGTISRVSGSFMEYSGMLASFNVNINVLGPTEEYSIYHRALTCKMNRICRARGGGGATC